MGIIDGNGISSHEFDFIVKWLKGCYKAGLLKEEEAGVSLQDYGSFEFFDRVVKQIVNRQGCGDLLAEGVHRASDSLGNVGKEYIDDVNRGFKESYQPRIIPTSAILAAVESSSRLSLYHTWASRILLKHAEEPDGRGWLSNDEWMGRIKELFGTDKVVDHSDEGFYQPDKAFLAKWTEDYKTAGAGCFILCDWVMGHFWSWYSNESNRRESAPENESRAFSLVTGQDMDVNGMLKLGERVRNIERAVMVREGRRRADDTLAEHYFEKHQEGDASDSKKAGYVPGADGHWMKVTHAIDRKKWERLKDFYYAERGWNQETGIPTRKKLEELDLKDIADGLEKHQEPSSGKTTQASGENPSVISEPGERSVSRPKRH